MHFHNTRMNISSRNPMHTTPPSPSNIITSEVLIQSDSDSDLDEAHGLNVSQETAAQTSLLPLPSHSPHSLQLPPRPANIDSLRFERTEEIAPASSSLPEAETHSNVSRRTRDDLPIISNKDIIDDRIKNHHDVLPNSSHHAQRRQKAYQPIAYRVRSPPLHHYYRQTEDNLIRHQPSISICRPFCMLVTIVILSLMTYLENVGNILNYHAGNEDGANERRFRGRVRVGGRVKGKVSGENGAGFKLFGKNISARAVVNGSDAFAAGEDAFNEEEKLLLFPTTEDGQILIDSRDLDDDDSIPVDDDGYSENYFEEDRDKQINDLDININANDEQDFIHISSNEDVNEGLVQNENVDVGDSIAGYEYGGVTNATNNLDNTGVAADKGISAQYNLTDNSELDITEIEGLSKSNALTDDLQADVSSKMNDQNENNTIYSEAKNAANNELNEQHQNVTSAPTTVAAEDEEPPLPEGWMEDILPQLGKPYYYNKITGESSLERPLPDVIVGEETDLQTKDEGDIRFGFNGFSSENAFFP